MPWPLEGVGSTGPGICWATGQPWHSLPALPRGPRDTPLPGVLHAETVAQRDPRKGHKCRHYTSLPPGTQAGSLLVGVWAHHHFTHTCLERW